MTADPEADAVTPDVVAAARRLSPQIVAAGNEAERLRQIPPALADALASAGLYRMYLPRTLGGSELPPLTVFNVIEELSKADGSVGWCLMNANGVSLGAGWLAPDVGREMFGRPSDIRAAGSLRPQGRARPVAGGYQVTGRWNFASGLHNANWLFCPCLVMDGEAPQLTAAGMSATRTMWVPAAAAKFIDTWSAMGMRGTGSHDFVIEDLFVPQAHSVFLAGPPTDSGPLYRPRFFLTLVHVLFAANALGIARGAISALINMASSEATSLSPVLLRDRPFVQSRLGQAEAIVGAARCYVIESLARMWAAICADEIDPIEPLTQLRLAVPHAIQEAVRTVDLIFHAAGTNAAHTANPLERQFRDIHIAAQHYAAFPVHFESAGKILLGLRPSEPGW